MYNLFHTINSDIHHSYSPSHSKPSSRVADPDSQRSRQDLGIFSFIFSEWYPLNLDEITQGFVQSHAPNLQGLRV